MFHRILFDDWVVIFPLVAFIVAASVYSTITYRALRMGRGQIDRFAHLPFNDEIAARHEHAEKK